MEAYFWGYMPKEVLDFMEKKKNPLRTKKLSFKSWTEKPEAADKLILAAVAQRKLADVKKKKSVGGDQLF